ncbi:ATPase [Catenovulum agarivorans DS-2]|uniref:ATPase n=1 Tax=Catenovulum agarivorans DS-2 TaxID=1328313 RepID=W7Q6V4_9ALTE|nr:MoxR family ATPase [Catenovulum agarivorans]EWH08514.1 ATPase [Catenovulum agarivorans DS-2]
MEDLSSLAQKIVDQVCQQVLGKPQQVKLALTCLLAKGHLLIEDLPGMGKTTLSHALAHTMGLSYNRVQFTSDLLPADITGVSVYNQQAHKFEFHPGPLFNQVVLADEINRASPKTQSALLEAMAEQQVTVDGTTYPMTQPFFVIATQNPQEQVGTHPLPESQLDRFLMRIRLGYPTAEYELLMLQNAHLGDQLENIECCQVSDLVQMQQAVEQVYASEEVLKYIIRLSQYTRSSNQFSHALSPRGSTAVKLASQAWAFLHGRDYVQPDDVTAVFSAVAEHRINPEDSLNQQSVSDTVLQSVDVIS